MPKRRFDLSALDVKYNISGPSAVMWTTDVDIRNGINRLCKAEKKDENWKEDVGKLLTMLDDMIYKEENILFPNCAVNFPRRTGRTFIWTPKIMTHVSEWKMQHGMASKRLKKRWQ